MDIQGATDFTDGIDVIDGNLGHRNTFLRAVGFFAAVKAVSVKRPLFGDTPRVPPLPGLPYGIFDALEIIGPEAVDFFRFRFGHRP